MARSINRCPKCKHCWIEGDISRLSTSTRSAASATAVQAETQRWRVFVLNRDDICADLRDGMSIAEVGRKYDFNLKEFLAEGAKDQYEDLREALGGSHTRRAIQRSGHAQRGLEARRRRRD